jgi:thioredoxin-like negative regulator of GroEL
MEYSKLKRRAEFKEFIKNNPDKLVLVFFTAKWCVNCPALVKHLEKCEFLENENVLLMCMEEKENEDIVHALRVTGFPTIMSYYDGDLQFVRKGSDEKQFKEFIELNKKLLLQ